MRASVYLLHHVPGLEPGDAAVAASAAVGDLPLAIEQAGAWLAETGMPAAVYVEWVETQVTSALGAGKPLDYAAPVAAPGICPLTGSRSLPGGRAAAADPRLLLAAHLISMTLLYGDEMKKILLPVPPGDPPERVPGEVIGDISRLALVRIDQAEELPADPPGLGGWAPATRSQMTADEQLIAIDEVHQILVGARPRRGETDDPANSAAYD